MNILIKNMLNIILIIFIWFMLFLFVFVLVYITVYNVLYGLYVFLYIQMSHAFIKRQDCYVIACQCIYVCMCVCMHVCMCMHAHTYTRVLHLKVAGRFMFYVRAHTYVCMYVCNVCIYIYI